MKKIFILVLVGLLMTSVLAGCTAKTQSNSASGESQSQTETELADDVTVNIAMLKGPTGIGAVELMDKSESGEAKGNYNVTVTAASDDVTAKIISGEFDIAAVPTNLAAVLYNKTEGGVTVLAVNTLGVLYVLENGESVNSISDLSGKTIYSSGQGAVPEYVLNYLLEKNGINDASVEYKSQHEEVASALADGSAQIAMLPEPFVTAVTMKNTNLRIALDVTDEWDKVSDSELAMGCIIVRNDFLKENEGAVKTFLSEYKESIDYVNNNVTEASQLVEKFGIMATAQAAEKSIPNCNIVFIDGSDMEKMLNDLYDVLYAANPKSIGGTVPEKEFYYESK